MSQPWIWWGLGLAIAAILLKVACWYLDQLTFLPDDDVDETGPVMFGEHDPLDYRPDMDQVLLEREFPGQVEAWLHARARYEERHDA